MSNSWACLRLLLALKAKTLESNYWYHPSSYYIHIYTNNKNKVKSNSHLFQLILFFISQFSNSFLCTYDRNTRACTYTHIQYIFRTISRFCKFLNVIFVQQFRIFSTIMSFFGRHYYESKLTYHWCYSKIVFGHIKWFLLVGCVLWCVILVNQQITSHNPKKHL